MDFIKDHDFFFRISNHTMGMIKKFLRSLKKKNDSEVKWVCEICGYEEKEGENLAYCPIDGGKMIPVEIE